MAFMALEDAMELIRMEYHELPGLTLTFRQARCLWNLSDQICELALSTLVRDGFLVTTPAGTFVRSPESRVSVIGSATLALAPWT